MQVYTHPVHCKLRSILKLLFTIQGVNIHRHISMYTHVQVDNVVWMSTRDMFRRWTMFSIFFLSRGCKSDNQISFRRIEEEDEWLYI